MTLPNPCRVLVVDDHPDSAESLARVVETMGHTAEYLTSPLRVAEAIERFKPHVLLLDIAMPEIDGWTLAGNLRKQYDSERLKIVAITAFARDQDRVRSRKAGFDAHVAKPLDPETVGQILEQCFSPGVRPR